MAEKYARTAARVVVGQTAESSGFDGIQRSASDALSELLLRYISEIGYLTHTTAEYAGRSECNINDLLLAFQDMGIDMNEIMEYAGTMEEVPFAHTMPRLPAVRKPPAFKSFKELGEEPPAHIPDFLPAFPEKHNYAETAVYSEHTKDAREQRQAQMKAKKDAEKAIIHLSARERAAKAHVLAAENQTNLFLAPPIIETAADAMHDQDTKMQEAAYSPSGAWEGAWKPKKQIKILEKPFQLDWTLPMLPSVPPGLPFGDAFADMHVEETEKAGRKRRQSTKSMELGDPQHRRAEQIISAGAGAIFELDDGQPEKSAR